MEKIINDNAYSESSLQVALKLYNEGYRKTTFNERFSCEYIRETLKEELCQEVREETAKEILTRIKNMYKENGFCINHTTKLFIEQLAKEYGVEIEE